MRVGAPLVDKKPAHSFTWLRDAAHVEALEDLQSQPRFRRMFFNERFIVDAPAANIASTRALADGLS